MADFTMPSLGADMEAGTLVEWKVKAGDAVKRGDIVAAVDTNKGLIDIEIWESGVLDALLVQPGAKVPVGTVLARVRAGGGAPAIPAPAAAPTPAPAPAPSGVPPRASPAARQLARELGVDLAAVSASVGGQPVGRGDVEAFASKAAPAPVAPAAPAAAPAPVAAPARAPTAAPAPAPAMRQAIAAAMARSKHEIPHYYLGTSIDLSKALAFLAGYNAPRPAQERILPVVLALRAVALAVAEVPEMNGWLVEGAFKPSAAVHLGVGVALRQGGLVAPALHDVEKKRPPQLQAELADLVARARAGGLRSSELADGTLTVTNLGDNGVDDVFGVIYPPQVALVGLGRIATRPWAVGDALAARPVLRASLSADHRVSDGHRGALFLAAVDRLLQSPEAL